MCSISIFNLTYNNDLFYFIFLYIFTKFNFVTFKYLKIYSFIMIIAYIHNISNKNNIFMKIFL